jgi:hypothetical protein
LGPPSARSDKPSFRSTKALQIIASEPIFWVGT